MHRYHSTWLGIALAAAFVAHATPVLAQQPARETVPFKFSVRSKVDLQASYTIPIEPPLSPRS